MKTYTILPRGEAFDWNSIPALKMEAQMYPREHGISAQAQLCYDDTALYVRMQTTEANIRAEYTGLLDEISEDSCLEFFFCPVEGDDRYFNLEINPNAAMYFGFGASIETLQRLIPECPAVRPQITRTDDGWVVTFAIPHDFVRLFFPTYAPAAGKTIKANCYKCGELTEIPHWLCWSPVPAERKTFHCPEYFGQMQFA